MPHFTTQQEKDLYEDLKELIRLIEEADYEEPLRMTKSLIDKSEQLKEKYLIPDA